MQIEKSPKESSTNEFSGELGTDKASKQNDS